MWINHHGFFNHLRRIDSPFLFANGFLLLMVTLINFPTAVLARYIDTACFAMASAFYCGSMVLVSIAYNLLWLSAVKGRRLVKEEVSEAIVLRIRNAYRFGFLVYLGAFAICFFVPLAGLIIVNVKTTAR